ncbi:hypothetical protein P5673_008618 [Acropora cervicornis]|uniref:Uncharacterized protein n=1 Tax=Acropora cervicornis TaxID=6130 RepID=A0AAD9QT23_ACRCE|nr:hypothetical protein P5673_008618 [Acropora cervicornis]
MTSYLRKLCTCLFHLTILQRSNLYHEKIENAILIRQLLIRDDNCDYDILNRPKICILFNSFHDMENVLLFYPFSKLLSSLLPKQQPGMTVVHNTRNGWDTTVFTNNT